MAPDLPPNVAESPADSQLVHTPQPSTPTAPECSKLESLPGEVLIHIIRTCGPKDMASRAVALNLCLVSKRIEPVARRELYRRIVIVTYKSLGSLYRTLKKMPDLGQYIVQLKLLVPTGDLGHSNAFYASPEIEFQLLWSMYFDVLERSTGLRKLTMALAENGRNSLPTERTYNQFIARLSDAIARSPRSDSAKAILPRLERVRLTGEVCEQSRPHNPTATVQTEVFKPFLLLPSLLSLKATNDSGSWAFRKSTVHRVAGYTRTETKALRHEQLKSVVLRESDCNSANVMDLVNMFPAMEVLFVQNHQRSSSYSQQGQQRTNILQPKADQSGKRYLSDSFQKLQQLNTLAYVPHGNGLGLLGSIGDFLGPSNFLSLKQLCNLTSISVLIDVFASPGRSTTGRLTVSPTEVLPRSLRSLHIIVDHHSQGGVWRRDALDKALFQPRAAALGFMEELASFCPSEFPSLRQVEYIWAVTRVSDISVTQTWLSTRSNIHLSGDGVQMLGVRCDGSAMFCCDMHTRMQALSPEMDYTSKAEGIISPFRARFDSLQLTFGLVGVTFNVVELKKYNEFYRHWQQVRE